MALDEEYVEGLTERLPVKGSTALSMAAMAPGLFLPLGPAAALAAAASYGSTYLTGVEAAREALDYNGVREAVRKLSGKEPKEKITSADLKAHVQNPRIAKAFRNVSESDGGVDMLTDLTVSAATATSGMVTGALKGLAITSGVNWVYTREDHAALAAIQVAEANHENGNGKRLPLAADEASVSAFVISSHGSQESRGMLAEMLVQAMPPEVREQADINNADSLIQAALDQHLKWLRGGKRGEPSALSTLFSHPELAREVDNAIRDDFKLPDQANANDRIARNMAGYMKQTGTSYAELGLEDFSDHMIAMREMEQNGKLMPPEALEQAEAAQATVQAEAREAPVAPQGEALEAPTAAKQEHSGRRLFKFKPKVRVR